MHEAEPPLPPRIQAYVAAIVRTCATSERTSEWASKRALMSVVLFGSAATGGFSEGCSGTGSDVDLILVIPDDASRDDRLRVRDDGLRLEAVRPLPPIRRFDVFKAFHGLAGQILLSAAVFPLLPDATKYAMGALKRSVHNCFFCYHGRRAPLQEEVDFFQRRLGPSSTLARLLDLRRAEPVNGFETPGGQRLKSNSLGQQEGIT